MFCRNCGSRISDFAKICVKCGVPVESGSQYCQNCGIPLQPGMNYCPRCGRAVGQNGGEQPYQRQKSRIAAGMLGIFLGWLGIHNFYLGYRGRAAAQLLISLLSFGALAWIPGIWGFIEGIMILTGSVRCDAEGIPLRE